MVVIGNLRDRGVSAIMKIVISGKLCGPFQTEMPLHRKYQPKPLRKGQRINVSEIHRWKIEEKNGRNFKF